MKINNNDSILKMETYKKALEIWGVELQIDVLIEELSELIQVMIHHKRGRAKDNHILEEMADVTIMMEQIRFMLKLSDYDMDRLITKKLKRTLSRLQDIEESAV